jgi:DNA-binding transcriptional ArsR family regulator
VAAPPADIQRVTDPTRLRALAHPLRGRLLRRLRTHGPATASELGRVLAESSGATSYHLRQLATHGYVELDDDQPSRREKRWRAVARMTTFSAADLDGDPAGFEAETAVLEHQARTLAARAEHWVETRERWPAPWRHAAELSDYLPRLTPAALASLAQDVGRLVAEAEAASVGAPDAETTVVALLAFPEDDEALRQALVGARPRR